MTLKIELYTLCGKLNGDQMQLNGQMQSNTGRNQTLQNILQYEFQSL